MKLYLVLVTLMLSFWLADAKMTVPQLRKTLGKATKGKCSEKTGVSKESLDNAGQGIFDFSDDKLKCFYYCVMETAKMMDKEGRFSLEATMRQIDLMVEPSVAARTYEASSHCIAAITDADNCGAAMQWSKCYREFAPEVYLFP